MGELLILILLIGLVFYIISKVRESPFRYPYFEYCFDVSGKRKPNIEDFIDAYINNNGSNGVQGVQTRLKRKDRFESK